MHFTDFCFVELSVAEVRQHFSDLELERLHRYLRSLLDFPMVADQLPELANLFFLRRFPGVKLNKTQQVSFCEARFSRQKIMVFTAFLIYWLGDSLRPGRPAQVSGPAGRRIGASPRR